MSPDRMKETDELEKVTLGRLRCCLSAYRYRIISLHTALEVLAHLLMRIYKVSNTYVHAHAHAHMYM